MRLGWEQGTERPLGRGRCRGGKGTERDGKGRGSRGEGKGGAGGLLDKVQKHFGAPPSGQKLPLKRMATKPVPASDLGNWVWPKATGRVAQNQPQGDIGVSVSSDPAVQPRRRAAPRSKKQNPNRSVL